MCYKVTLDPKGSYRYTRKFFEFLVQKTVVLDYASLPSKIWESV